MKNTSMNQYPLVSMFTLMFLVFGVPGILLTSLFLVGCGGDEEEDTPEASVGANPLVDKEEEVPPIVRERAEPPLNDLGVCAIGLTLKAGESCNYVAGEANVVFSVLQDGSACREGGPVIQEVLGAQVQVDNAKFCRNDNIEQDDAFKSNFAADKNPDGSWTINNLPLADDEAAVPTDGEDCQVGDILAPGEHCTYPGNNNIEFSVLNNGSGRFVGGGLFLNVGGGTLDTRNIFIGGVEYPFVAKKQADGTWVIEAVGGNPVEVDNLDAQCEILPLNEDWGGEPVLFSLGREGTGAILLSDGKFVVFIYKDPADPPPINVYGGPVQTATKALVQFAGFDALNKDGVGIPDGEITEFEVSDAFMGVIDIEENRRILKMKLPEQKGETIKGNNTVTMWLDVTGPCTLDINKVPPALSAELIEYAKDLLDIMRGNPQ